MKIIAFSDATHNPFEYRREEAIGRPYTDFLVDFPVQYLPSIRKLIYALNGAVEYSHRCILQDKYSRRSMKVTSKGITTDSDGHTYDLIQLELGEFDGTENSLSSLKFHRRSAFDISESEIERLTRQYQLLPWLGEFLRN